MKSELINVSSTRKEINLQIEPQQVREAFDRISEQYARSANVPGFRKGHAPSSVIRTRYKSEIRGDVLREILPHAVNDAIVEHSLVAIAEPDVHLDNPEQLEKLGQEPIKVKVGVEVLPEVKLGEYKGLEVTRKQRPVSDEDVDKMIEAFRDGSASLQPVEDRPSQAGDTVTVNILGKISDRPDEEDIKADEVDVVVGGQGVQPEFTENLTGAKPDETRTFTVVYPEDFKTKELAGRTVDYTAEVTAVRTKELPEVDDDWAKSLGEELESVEDLRAKIREELEQRSIAEADGRVRNEVMKKLLKAHQFEVPQSLVEQQTNHRLESVMRDMIRRGVDPRGAGLDWQGAREELKGQAEDDVRASLLMDQIAQNEKITVSDEEIDAEIEAISLMSRQPKEQVRAALTKDGGDRSIAQRLRNRKALDLLIANAQVKEEEWTDEEKSENE
ncbi:MAG TPA: trigger factor [Pyrinomonadaceae bacterium]|nr:trigger factor [Pyrinomonadaceae bacterium]